MRDEPSWNDTFRRLAQSVEDRLSTHPDADTFMAHFRGELAEPELEAFEEHLAWCRDCAGLYRDLPLLLEGEAVSVDPVEKAEDWEALQERLEREGAAVENPSAATGTTSRRIAPGSAVAAALAATLAVALVGAGLWIATLSGRLEELQRPRPNVPIHDLSPPVAERAETRPTAAVEVDRNAVLILNTRAELGERRYEAWIFDDEGMARETVHGLEPTGFGNFVLELPAGSLSPGVYRIVVQAEGADRPVGEYAIRVVEPPQDSSRP